MSTESTPAAAAVTPAPAPAESVTVPGPALNIPAPVAENPDTTQQPPAAESQDPDKPSEVNEGQPEGTEDESARSKKKTAGQYINELKQQRNDARSALAQAHAELQRLKQPLEAPGPDATQDEIDRYNVKSAVREGRAEEIQQVAEIAAEQSWRTMRATFEAKAEAVADRMPGLVDKFMALPVVSPEIANFVADSDKGAEVAFYLTQNQNEASRISRLHPYQQGIELARIEGRLQVAPQVRKVSAAPPPVPSSPGAPSPAQKSPAQMSVEDMQRMLYPR